MSDLRPGWRTDFFVHSGSALILERADCIVVRTPDNPGYYWGNCLVLPAAPADGELDHWLQRFEQEITSAQPSSMHVALGVNAAFAQEQLPGWRAAGFDLHVSAVMCLRPGALRRDVKAVRGVVQVRAIEFPSEVADIIDLECTDTTVFEPAGYRQYRNAKFQRYAQMHAQGRLHWFGAWCDGVLAASCGVMCSEAGDHHTEQAVVARFQHVYTHPGWRRRGLCTALVEAASAFAQNEWRCTELFMLANPDDVAIDIYRSLGYQTIDSEWALQRNAPQDRRTSQGAP